MDIPEADRATKVDLERKEFPVTKTLGVAWIVQEDKFSFSFAPPPEELVITKRNVLKKTASIYDPFGFLTPDGSYWIGRRVTISFEKMNGKSGSKSSENLMPFVFHGV